MKGYNARQLEIMNALADYHIENHTEEDQVLKLIEEMGELIQVFIKYIFVRKGTIEKKDYDAEKLLEEFFDLDFMMFQFKKYFLIFRENTSAKYAYMKIVNLKLKRELDRWGIKVE